jgi:hypothetical protein
MDGIISDGWEEERNSDRKNGTRHLRFRRKITPTGQQSISGSSPTRYLRLAEPLGNLTINMNLLGSPAQADTLTNTLTRRQYPYSPV